MEWDVRESDDARPKREVRWANEPWKPRWLSDLLAAVPLYPRGPWSDSVQVLLKVGHYERFERESHCPDDLGAARHNFSVRDVDAWWQKLRNHVEVVEALFDTPYGTRKFTVKDPDGNELGFVRED